MQQKENLEQRLGQWGLYVLQITLLQEHPLQLRNKFYLKQALLLKKITLGLEDNENEVYKVSK